MNYPTVDETNVLSASAALSEQFVDYIDSLGLNDSEGNPITSENLKDYIARLMPHSGDYDVQEAYDWLKKVMQQL